MFGASSAVSSTGRAKPAPLPKAARVEIDGTGGAMALCRRALGITEGRRVVLFMAANLSRPLKGADLLIAATALLADRRPDARVRVVPPCSRCSNTSSSSRNAGRPMRCSKSCPQPWLAISWPASARRRSCHRHSPQ